MKRSATIALALTGVVALGACGKKEESFRDRASCEQKYGAGKCGNDTRNGGANSAAFVPLFLPGMMGGSSSSSYRSGSSSSFRAPATAAPRAATTVTRGGFGSSSFSASS